MYLGLECCLGSGSIFVVYRKGGNRHPADAGSSQLWFLFGLLSSCLAWHLSK